MTKTAWHGIKYLEVSTHYYSTQALDQADNTFELGPEQNITVNLDLGQAGVGNMPHLRLPQYNVPNDPVQFAVVMIPGQNGGSW